MLMIFFWSTFAFPLNSFAFPRNTLNAKITTMNLRQLRFSTIIQPNIFLNAKLISPIILTRKPISACPFRNISYVTYQGYVGLYSLPTKYHKPIVGDATSWSVRTFLMTAGKALPTKTLSNHPYQKCKNGPIEHPTANIQPVCVCV